MLDPLAPILHAMPDSLGSVCVRRDIRAGILCTLHHRSNLFASKLEMVNLVRWTANTSGAHDLDEITPRPNLLAHSLHALRNTVANPPEPRRCSATTGRVIMLASEIRMPARLRQRMAGNEEPRTRENAVFDRFFDGRVSASAVPHAGEAAVQHLRANVRLAEQADGFWISEGLGEFVEAWDGDEVDVAVDEAGAEVEACAVDCGHSWFCGRC